jgi:integrase
MPSRRGSPSQSHSVRRPRVTEPPTGADGLVDLIAEHVDEVGTVGDQQWLFSQSDGPVHQNSVGYWRRKTLQAAGLSGIKLHDLRHFYASGLIAAGRDVFTVQRSLGHAKATTTVDTYAHLWPTVEDRTRAAAQSIIDLTRRPD